ncbi:iron uptake transporter deferrochelatase/peroxidase subunit [Thorsellia anophelis]|nr:iron uptake transporter deferrochelatase/peroxidase subunit [Thorsellia anophelis]
MSPVKNLQIDSKADFSPLSKHICANNPQLPNRRKWIKSLSSIGISAAISGLSIPFANANESLKNDLSPKTPKSVCAESLFTIIPPFGVNQAGITTPETTDAIFVAFKSVAPDIETLKTLFTRLTNRIVFLTQGGTPAAKPNKNYPPSESGMLGQYINPDSLTITVSVGATLFDKRYGLISQKPIELIDMPDFPNDALDTSWCDGDLLLQICANSKETVIYALRDIIKNTSQYLVPFWKIDGFLPSKAIKSNTTPINLFGFKDGTGNPSKHDNSLMNQIVWVGPNSKEPSWTHGGSYQAVRLIRQYLEFWDRTPLKQQEADFGRHKGSGAHLGKTDEFEEPYYAHNQADQITPIDSHVRRAEPRKHGRHDAKLLRRSYNYSLGLTKASQLDMGLIFVSYQSSLQKGFIDTQNRLNGEPLEEYIKPFGGGFFFALPGFRENEILGSGLFKLL